MSSFNNQQSKFSSLFARVSAYPHGSLHLHVAQELGCLFGNHCVDEHSGTEFKAGRPGQPRDDAQIPVEIAHAHQLGGSGADGEIEIRVFQPVGVRSFYATRGGWPASLGTPVQRASEMDPAFPRLAKAARRGAPKVNIPPVAKSATRVGQPHLFGFRNKIGRSLTAPRSRAKIRSASFPPASFLILGSAAVALVSARAVWLWFAIIGS